MRNRPWIWIVLLTFLVVLGTGGLYLSRQVGDKGWWAREAERYNREHTVLDEDNAALLYATLGSPRIQFKFPAGDWSFPVSASELSLLEGQEPRLALLREGALKPACFYALNPKVDGAAQLLPYLNPLQQGANLLVLDARWKAGEGKVDEALESLLVLARAGFQQERSFLITGLVGSAMRGMAWKGLERLSMDAPPSPEALEKAEEALAALSRKRASAHENWEVERLVGLGAIEEYYRPSTFGMLSGADLGLLRWVQEALTHPIDRTRQELEETYALLAKEGVTASELAAQERRTAGQGMFARMLLPALGKSCLTFQRDLALERGTRLLLRIRAHRLRHGAYPDAVEPLEDPFSGKPFVYRKLEGDRFLLYSVGLNGKDEGGIVDYREYDPTRTGDLVFGRPPTP